MRTTSHVDGLRRDIRQTFSTLHPSSSTSSIPTPRAPPYNEHPHPYPTSYPYPPGPGPGFGHGLGASPSSRESLLSRYDLDQLKKDLIAELREEVRTTTKHVMAACLYGGANGLVGGGRGMEGSYSGMMPEPQAVPQLSSELYHTHLYTQLWSDTLNTHFGSRQLCIVSPEVGEGDVIVKLC